MVATPYYIAIHRVVSVCVMLTLYLRICRRPTMNTTYTATKHCNNTLYTLVAVCMCYVDVTSQKLSWPHYNHHAYCNNTLQQHNNTLYTALHVQSVSSPDFANGFHTQSVLQCRCSVVAVLLQCCCSVVAVLLQCCCSVVAVLLQCVVAVCWCSVSCINITFTEFVIALRWELLSYTS